MLSRFDAAPFKMTFLFVLMLSTSTTAFCRPSNIRHASYQQRFSPLSVPFGFPASKKITQRKTINAPPSAISFRAGVLESGAIWDQIQNKISRMFGTVSTQTTPLAAVMSIPFWKEVTRSLQRMGENIFTALILVALLQGGLAVFQYRTNPSGELIVPPGPTAGVEEPIAETRDVTSENPVVGEGSRQTASSIRSGAQTTTTNQTSTATSNMLMTKEATEITPTSHNASSEPSENSKQSRYATSLQRINKFLVLLIPWLAGQTGVILQQYTHLFHIGSVLTLASVFDVPQSYFRRWSQKNGRIVAPNKEQFSLLHKSKEEYHVVVVGDSLAIGLGTVDVFDKNKNNSLPFMRIENVNATDSSNKETSPAFPRALAQTLAQKLQKRVSWRSAGVDGGDVEHIRKFCLGVIEEELDRGKKPDVVVILCGANDMKYFLSNPFKKSKWPKGFRARLSNFIEEIRDFAPQTAVILPAIPSQMFHKNSPLNVFPLGVLLDTMVGFWDSQKKFVADSYPSAGVLYLGLSPGEINQWYQTAEEQVAQDDRVSNNDIIHILQDIDNLDEEKLSSASRTGMSLIATDGVHPNARCYAHWAQSIGNKLLAALRVQGQG